MDKLLNLKLAKPKPKTIVVEKLTTRQIKNIKGTPTKLVIHGKLKKSGKKIFTEEAWVCRNGKKKVKTLWVDPGSGEIQDYSHLGLVMKYYNITSLQDFVGKELEVFPDPNNYLVIAACPVDESLLKNNINKEDLY